MISSSHSRFAAWVRQWLRAHRPRTIVRPACLELEHLEAREMPARAAALALGAEAGQLPRVQLSDREMTLIRTWTAYDSSVTSGVKAALADLNRDGVPEVVTVAFSGSRPLVRVWEGVSGTLMSQFWAGGFQVEGEVHVAAGEIGHGESGVVVGLTAGGRSQVRVFTSEGVLRRRIEVGPAAWTGAVRVALGYGTSGNAVVWVAAGPGGAPLVQSYEVRTGQALARFTAYAPTMTGGVWVAAADLTGDGVSEVITGTGRGYVPRVRVFSSSGRPLTTFIPTSTSDRQGVVVGARNDPGGGPAIATLVGPEGVKRLRLFAVHADGSVEAVASGSAAGMGTLASVADRAEVKRYEDAPAVPRELRQVFRWRAAGVAGRDYSAFPVRYGDGVVHFQEVDFVSSGFGTVWGVSRSWTNEGAYSQGQNIGRGWMIAETPSLIREVDPLTGREVLTVVRGGAVPRVYDRQDDGSYVGRGGILESLVYDAASGRYVWTTPDGRRVWFWDFDSSRSAQQRGQFVRFEDPRGNVTEVTSVGEDGRIEEVQRWGPGNGVTVTESYLFSYITAGVNAGRIASIIQRRRVDEGAWGVIRQAEYVYYDGVEPNGNAGDLKKVVLRDGAGAILGTSYYRYYVVGESNGYEGGLKFVLRPASYARLAANVTDPESASDAQIAPYADHYFEYDDQFRVTKEVAAGAGDDDNGGRGTFTFSYTVNEVPTFGGPPSGPGTGTDPNVWQVKTVETLPDGHQNIVYTNAARQVMLKVFQDTTTGQQWRWFYRYDSAGRLVLAAGPDAVTGYDEVYPDLLHQEGGNYQYLSDSSGWIGRWTYSTITTATETVAGEAAGRLRQVAIQQGEWGAEIPQQQWSYMRRVAGGSELFFVASVTAYRQEDGTGAQTTTFAYTWQGDTAQPESITVTWPLVPEEQNGSGVAAAVTTVLDRWGRPIWQKDEAGFLTYIEYDLATGAVVKTIEDVDTTQTSTFRDLPSGWSTPSGGGQHRTTTYEVDTLGRVTQVSYASGRVDYLIYDDLNREVRVYAGWDASTQRATLPTWVQRSDWAHGYVETLTMAATPTVSNGRPTGTEAIDGLQTLSRTYTNPSGQVIYTDAYFNLAGLSYTPSPNLGEVNTHFYRTEYGYDAAGRLDRTVSPTGTIYRDVYDGLGRLVSQWVGLDDTPEVGVWSPLNTAGTDLVQVREYEYDQGGVGAGNLTRLSEYPGLGASPRVTRFWYDWRNRLVASKAGVEENESEEVNRPLVYVDYDNLGQAVATEVYDGDGVSLADADGDGVPDRPEAGRLRGRSLSHFDERGRVFRTQMFSVDPVTGAVSATALSRETWYDARGQVVKVAEPGGGVTKFRYDGLGRLTASFVSDGGGDTSSADAFQLEDDIVLSQAEYAYDLQDNLLQVTFRQRFHDATGTGELGTPTSGVAARVSYQGFYYDLADRLVATVDVGTNGGMPWTRPADIPARSDTVLVTSFDYDAAGRLWRTLDPKGIESRTEYDALGRTTKTIANYVDGIVGDDNDITTEYAYNAVGLTHLISRRSDGTGQTTEWVYGVSLASGSGLNSNDLVGQIRWPDPVSGQASTAEQEVSTVNALGEVVTVTDRNGNVHTLTYDVLGRLVADAVTTLGVGVDGAVRRIEYAYDVWGNVRLITSYDAAVGGSIVNQVQREFNGLGQLISEWQEHGGAVSSSTPRVQYTYSEMAGGANHSRLVSLTYPNGRVVTYNYAPGLDDALSRLSSLSDASGTLESYDYLGEALVVSRKHPQVGVDLTYIKQAGEADGEAGDQYTGLDRFGRVMDQRWLRSGDGTAVERLQYTYDRNGNRLSRVNLLNSELSESYSYDNLNQLISFTRGEHSRSWDYDAQGNWQSVVTDGNVQIRTHNAQNEITGISGAVLPTYDANGNLTRDEVGRQFVYDAWNRLVEVRDDSGETVKRYAYDGLHRRVQESAGGVTTDFYYSDQWQVVEERVGDNTTVQYVWSPVYVDALILRDRDTDGNGTLDERLWVVQDANFNVTAVVDSSGEVVERYVYDPFGQAAVLDFNYIVQSSGSSYDFHYGFQGLRYDSTTALSFTHTRPYSPNLGRFTVHDWIGFQGGDVNLYRFVGNMPINATDPTGQTLYISARDVGIWKEKFGSYINLVQVRNGLYRVDVTTAGRATKKFYNEVTNYLQSLNIVGEGDVVAQALTSLFDGGIREPSPDYHSHMDRVLDRPLENGGRLGSYQLMPISAYGLEGLHLNNLPAVLSAIAKSDAAKTEAAAIGLAIVNTFNRNYRMSIRPNTEQKKGYWCYEWAYAFEDAFKYESSGKYFKATIEGAAGKGDVVHFWLRIDSLETGMSIFVDDGFMNGSYIHDKRPAHGIYQYTPGLLHDIPRTNWWLQIPRAYDRNNRPIPIPNLPPLLDGLMPLSTW